MTMTLPDLDEMVLVDEETDDEEQCNHFQHGKHESHGDGPAKFEAMFPCGATNKVCAHFRAWFLNGNHTVCASRPGEVHDEASIIWLPL